MLRHPLVVQKRSYLSFFPYSAATLCLHLTLPVKPLIKRPKKDDRDKRFPTVFLNKWRYSLLAPQIAPFDKRLLNFSVTNDGATCHGWMNTVDFIRTLLTTQTIVLCENQDSLGSSGGRRLNMKQVCQWSRVNMATGEAPLSKRCLGFEWL